MPAFNTAATVKSFGGKLLKLTHQSATTGTEMALNLYLPPQADKGKVPVIFYLAGLTCTGDNGAEKAGFQATASKVGCAIVYPDTSPRGLKLPTEDDAYDFGSGAGFYLNATKAPWDANYHMYSYIVSELPSLLYKEFPLDESRASIMGHSMGGHGALTIFLKNPGAFKSVSAFAPICNPSQCPWGQKAFGGYLEGEGEWKEWDASELVKDWVGEFKALIDVGTGDNFYKQKQLLPENLIEAAQDAGKKIGEDALNVRFQDDYDHSYYFISTFGADHINYHAKFLGL